MQQEIKTFNAYRPFKIDAKCRVSIPPTWRPVENESFFLMQARTDDMPVLRVLSQADYNRRVQDIEESDHTPKWKKRRLGMLALLTREVQVNDQHKLFIPKEFCERAEIAPNEIVYLAGKHGYFEIWNQVNFRKHLALVEDEAEAEDEDDELGTFD